MGYHKLRGYLREDKSEDDNCNCSLYFLPMGNPRQRLTMSPKHIQCQLLSSFENNGPVMTLIRRSSKSSLLASRLTAFLLALGLIAPDM